MDNTRLGTAFDTADGFFDEVVGISQGIINQNFQQIFNSNVSAMGTMVIDDPILGTKGTLKMLAPRIMMKTDVRTDTGSVYYQLRFESGEIKIPRMEPIKLDGWEIAAECKIGDFIVREHKETDDQLSEAQQKHMTAVKKVFDVPGDYSVERLFAAVASAHWNHIDEKLSVCVVKGKRMSWSEWNDESPEYVPYLVTAFQSWASYQERKNLTTLGVRFKLPKPKPDTDESTPEADQRLAPTHVMSQIYPYQKNKDTPSRSGTGGDAEYNCFLYCETCGRDLPTQTQLQWRGNLAGPTLQGKHVDGTFALHYKLFMERFLLPKIQGLCQAIEIIVSEPDRRIDNKDGKPAIWPNTSVGCQPEGTPEDQLRDALNSHFTLTRHPDKLEYNWSTTSEKGGKGAQDVYEYRKDVALPLGFGVKSVPVSYNYFNFRGSAELTVTWMAGSSELHISAKTTYYFLSRFTGSSALAADVNNTGSDVMYKTYQYHVPWSMKIKFSTTANGVLSATIIGCTNHVPDDLTTVKDFSYNQNTIDGTEDWLQKFLTKNLREVVKNMETNIEEQFATTGRFVYPGNGRLKFSNPSFNTRGDMLADITYAPLIEGKIAIPPPEKTQAKPLDIPTPATMSRGVKTLNTPTLMTWTKILEYHPETKRAKLLIRGTNTRREEIAFAYLEVKFIVNGDNKALFNGTKFKHAPGFLERHGISIPTHSKGAKTEPKQKAVVSEPSDTVTHDPDSASPPQEKAALVDHTEDASSKDSEKAHLEPKPSHDEKPAGDTYQLSVSAGGPGLELRADYPAPTDVLDCLISAKKNLLGSSKPFMFSFKPGQFIDITFEGDVSDLGTFHYTVHESWMATDAERDDPPSGMGDCTETCAVP